MQANQVIYKQSKINYYRFGEGPVPVVCFHGYGEEAGSFAFLGPLAGGRYTFYAMDLPFHGLTEWKEEKAITAADLLRIVQAILPKPGQAFLLMGFSLGGRACLHLYQQSPTDVSKIVLLAPDGIKVNPWYWFSTQTRAGNRLFNYTMKHPAWLFGLLKAANKLKWVNTSIFKFVRFYIGDDEVRRQLYERWTGLRKLKPGLARIRRSINLQKTPVRLIYGKYDRIILSSRGESFLKGIAPNGKLSILPAGHRVLDEKYASFLIEALDS